MAGDRVLKSYDDIAKYIVEQLQMAVVQEMPRELWDRMNHDYPSLTVYQPMIAMKNNSDYLVFRVESYGDHIDFAWELNSQRVFVQRFMKPQD